MIQSLRVRSRLPPPLSSSCPPISFNTPEAHISTTTPRKLIGMDVSSELQLPPGFRFHPTDEELVTHYLRKKAVDGSFTARAVAETDLNKCEPWDLPWKAKMGEKEWYFFCKKDRKYPTGLRTNRATGAGYWKATGKDKEVRRGDTAAVVGMKKTLVFYMGRAPRGHKTDWIMHEYRLEGFYHSPNFDLQIMIPKNEWVICRVFKKDAARRGPMAATTDFTAGAHVTCFSGAAQACPLGLSSGDVGGEYALRAEDWRWNC